MDSDSKLHAQDLENLFASLFASVEVSDIMIAALGDFLSFGTIVVTIISSSQCQSAFNVEEIGVKRYEKFMIKIEEPRDYGSILATILDQIIDVYMPEGSLSFILSKKKINTYSFAETLKEYLKRGRRNVMTVVPGARKFQLHKIVYQKPSVYFFHGIELPEVIKTLKSFGNIKSMWNPRGLWIGIAKSEDEAIRTMRNLWKNFVYKVVVLIFDDGTLDTVAAYTWRPYCPENNCGSPTTRNVIRLGKFASKTLKFEKETDIKPGIIPKRFKNCSIDISFNIWIPYVYPNAEKEGKGLEVRIIEMVCKSIGISLNANYHDMTLIRDESEAWAGARIPLASDVEDCDIPIPYIEDTLHWYVPRSEEYSLLNLSDGFSPLIWIPTILVVVVVSLSLIISTKNKHYWSLWIWGSLLEQSYNKLPKKIRGIWACWLLLCLHLSAAYRTVLYGQLTNPVSKYAIQNQSDLLDSGLELGFVPEAGLWFDEEDKVQKEILESYVPCETVPKCYNQIPNGKAVFTNKLLADYLDEQKYSSLHSRIRALPSSLRYKVAMGFVKGHAMAPRFNEVLLHMLEAGFMTRWLKELEETQIRNIMRDSKFNGEHKLSLAHTRSVFQILFIGLMIACLSFMYEMFVQSLSKITFLSYIERKRKENP